MVVLVVLMLGILVIAGVVVLYVAFPHRGEEVPGAPWLGEAMKRGVESVNDLLDLPAEDEALERDRDPARAGAHQRAER